MLGARREDSLSDMRHSSFLEINLSFLSENIGKIQHLAPKAKILSMVKADAYGNGLIPFLSIWSMNASLQP